MTELSPQDAPIVRMLARWVEDGDTPSLLPKTLSRHLRAIANAIEHERATDGTAP
jgi:hypothetical protein